MENANKGFLPLNSSSPIKEEDEEVAYRENQAAGFIAKRYFISWFLLHNYFEVVIIFKHFL